MLPRGLLKEYARPLSILLRIQDVLIVLLSGWLVYFYKFESFLLPERYKIALLLALGLTVGVFPFFHLYQSARAKNMGMYLRYLTQATVCVFMLLSALSFLTKSGEDFSRLWFLFWAGKALGLLVLSRIAIFFVLRLMRANGWNERRVVIIGATSLGIKLAESVQE